MTNVKAIYFDMDGTIADLYGDEQWLEKLRAYNPEPYVKARPLVNMSRLARYLNKLQKRGVKIGVISWLSKCSTPAYDVAVAKAKAEWLERHLKSVKFDEIKIVAHGLKKSAAVDEQTHSILFDDEMNNRVEWTTETRTAYSPARIFEILAKI